MQFNFTTREQYLEQVATWKDEYLDLSVAIVIARNKLKDANRAYSKSNSGPAFKAINDARDQLFALKKQATAMLKQRVESKIVAGFQYEVQRHKVA